MSFVLLLFVPHLFIFRYLGRLCFVIVGFTGYLHLYFSHVIAVGLSECDGGN